MYPHLLFKLKHSYNNTSRIDLREAWCSGVAKGWHGWYNP